LSWNPHHPSHLYISSEDGHLVAYDIRAATTPLFNLTAHSKALSCFAFSEGAPGLLATCSVDKTVKLWDAGVGGGEPVPLGEKSMAVGKLFTVSFYPSSPFLLATGGDKGMMALWNLEEMEAVCDRFRQRMGSSGSSSTNASQISSSFEGMSLSAEGGGVAVAASSS